MTDQLHRVEDWFFEAITHPEGLESGLEAAKQSSELPRIESMVTRSASMEAIDRLRIYSNAYIWRLIDVLAEEFPATQTVTAPEAFGNLCRQYLKAHRPTHYSLNQLGARFPQFLAEECESFPHREFAAQMARLERTMENVFDAPRSEKLEIDHLLALPAEQWGSARFSPVSAIQFLKFDFPVNAYLQAVRDGETPEPPPPKSTYLVIYRKDWSCWRLPISEPAYVILVALAEGLSLGDALERCLAIPGLDPLALTSALKGWFQEWTAEGFFQELIVETS